MINQTLSTFLVYIPSLSSPILGFHPLRDAIRIYSLLRQILALPLTGKDTTLGGLLVILDISILI
jgi:hypothetical protein